MLSINLRPYTEERRKREYVERDLKESEERTVQESERVDKAGLALTPPFTVCL